MKNKYLGEAAPNLTTTAQALRASSPPASDAARQRNIWNADYPCISAIEALALAMEDCAAGC